MMNLRIIRVWFKSDNLFSSSFLNCQKLLESFSADENEFQKTEESKGIGSDSY